MVPSPSTSTEKSRLAIWIALLTLTSVAFSMGFACATPFSAFAAAAALSLNMRQSLMLVALTWVANQAIGYGILNYPQTDESFGWGFVMGVAALLATYLSSSVSERFAHLKPFVRTLLVFLVAAGSYQTMMFFATYREVGHVDSAHFAIAWHVILIDIAAFAGLLAVNALGRNAGFLPETKKPAI